MRPLVVHLVFHSESSDARKLAERLHNGLNDDPLLPGLRVPTVFVPDDGSGLPPIDPDFAFVNAHCHFFVVLADGPMSDARDDLPPGRINWSDFVASIWERCRDNQRLRFFPVQLDEHGWPLDSRLREINFVRAHSPERSADEQFAFVMRRLIHELCRFMAGVEAGADGRDAVPLSVFLSHTKLDLDRDPQVVRELIEHLTVDQPVKTWFDSADIPAGESFAERIKEGIESSALLCVLTDNYGAREWCRREILAAKAARRPAIVVNALTSYEARSFPYLGNIPVLRWAEGAARRAIDVLLKENLRQQLVRADLTQVQRQDDVIFPSAPELLTVVGLPQGSRVLYPDPPLGNEELQILLPVGVEVSTPLERFAKERCVLGGCAIALSTSESTDIGRFGLGPMHLDSALLELSRYLLLGGATLAYGGHLGKEGYAVQLFDLVRAHNTLPNVKHVERVRSYVGWPWPHEASERRPHRDEATFFRVPAPEGVVDVLADLVAEPRAYIPVDSAEHRYAWSRGMTQMRRVLTAETYARVVIGGKFGCTLTAGPSGCGKREEWYRSRIPGAVEEAFQSLEVGKPLFLIGAFGGAARLVIDLLEGRDRPEMSWEYQRGAPHAEGMRHLYEARGEWVTYQTLRDLAAELGVHGLKNGLQYHENAELFVTQDVSRMVELVLQGLGNLRQECASTPA